MKNYVILTAIANVLFTQRLNEDKTPKLDSKGRPFGYLRVENPSSIDLAYAYNTGGVKKGQSALISMPVKVWESVKSHYSEGMQIPGRVVTTESLVKEIGATEKLAGNSEVICKVDGKPIYRKTTFVAEGAKDENGNLISIEDVLIAHDNSEEIKESLKISAEIAAEALNS